MANIYTVLGKRSNLLEQVPASGIVTTSEDSKFLKDNLRDGFPDVPFRFAAAGVDDSITADHNVIPNGNMETAGSGGATTLDSWQQANTGTGAVTRTTVGGEFANGTAGMKLASGTGTAVAYVDIEVRNGQRFGGLSFQMRGTGSVSAKIRIQNRQTGKWLKSDSTWQTTSQDVLTRTAGTFANVTLAQPFTVETMPAARPDCATMTLRVYVVNDAGSTTVWVDDGVLWFSWDFVSLHSHTADPSITVEVRSSTDNFAASNTLEATLVPYQPGFWTALGSMSDRRYSRLVFKGTNTSAIYVGEYVIAQKVSLQRLPAYGVKLEPMEDQIRPGRGRVYSKNDWPTRKLTLPFMYLNAAQYQEARDAVYGGGRGGRYPMVVVPLDTDPQVVIHGRIGPGFSVSFSTPNIKEGASFVVDENELLTVTA